MMIAGTLGGGCLFDLAEEAHDYKMLGLCPFSRARHGSGAFFITVSNNILTFLALPVLDYCQVWLPHSLKQRFRCQ